MENQFRFGVFLRPDPRTCAAVTQITGQLRAQYGMISAGAFPPHVTLAGSLPVVVPLAELIQLIGFVLRRRRTFAVQNLGIRRRSTVHPTDRSMFLPVRSIRLFDRCWARAGRCLLICTSQIAGCPIFRWSPMICGCVPTCEKRSRTTSLAWASSRHPHSLPTR